MALGKLWKEHVQSKGSCFSSDKDYLFITKASMLAEFFFALAIGSGMSCVP